MSTRRRVGVIDVGKAFGIALKCRNAEANAIRDQYIVLHPGQKPPSTSTVRDYVKKYALNNNCTETSLLFLSDLRPSGSTHALTQENEP